MSYEGLSPDFKAFTAKISAVQVPNCIEEAIKVPEWEEAIREQVMALEKNKTWVLSNLPEGKSTVGCKWIFTIKHRADGTRVQGKISGQGIHSHME